jgi:copper chaperone NosL
MKKLAPVLAAVLLLAIMLVLILARAGQQGHVTVLKGNTGRGPVPIEPGRFQDTQCGMPLERSRDAAEAVDPGGKTWFFDDVGCLALWLDGTRHPDRMQLWVFSRDTEKWIDGREAWYSLTDSTTMLYGFAAYRDSQAGFVDFTGMCARMVRGENLTNPYTRKELLGNR